MVLGYQQKSTTTVVCPLKITTYGEHVADSHTQYILTSVELDDSESEQELIKKLRVQIPQLVASGKLSSFALREDTKINYSRASWKLL